MVDISIIIPFYNTDLKLFQNCIESIEEQTYKSYEVIIVNDGSDKTSINKLQNLCNKYNNIKVISTENRGVSSARNTGIRCANGKYVMFIDSDDVIANYTLENAIKACEDYELDMVIGRITKCKEKPQFTFHNNCRVEIFDKKSGLENMVFASYNEYNDEPWRISFQASYAKLIKREIAQKELFPEGIEISEDTIWNYLILKNHVSKIGIVKDNWYGYIQNNTSVLNKYTDDFVLKIVAAIHFFDKLMDGYSVEYINWIFTKLRQIVYSYYLSPMCSLSHIQIQRDYIKMIKMSPFADLLQIKFRYGIKINLRIILYRSKYLINYLDHKKKMTLCK